MEYTFYYVVDNNRNKTDMVLVLLSMLISTENRNRGTWGRAGPNNYMKVASDSY
jgi:hypothetical protein